MAAEFSNTAVQTVAPNFSVIYSETPSPCRSGIVRHREGTGNILLSGGRINNRCNRDTDYRVSFSANIAIPTGGTVGEISLGIAVDGNVIPYTIMRVTPAALNTYFNVAVTSLVPIWNQCCQDVSVINTSTQDILVQNANIVVGQ